MRGKAEIRQDQTPPRSQFLFNCGNRILLKSGRSPKLGHGFLLGLHDVDPTNKMHAHCANHHRPTDYVAPLPWTACGLRASASERGTKDRIAAEGGQSNFTLVCCSGGRAMPTYVLCPKCHGQRTIACPSCSGLGGRSFSGVVIGICA
jgi:hypothetical protein